MSELECSFENMEQQSEASRLGMWVFLASEALFFGALLTAYAVYRYNYPLGFAEASAHLNIMLGSVNTAVLLGSSFTVVMAVHAAQALHRRALILWLSLTILLGLVFLGIKATEYAMEIHEGFLPGQTFNWHGELSRQAEMFFLLYFIMTSLHALHMIGGIVVHAVLLLKSRGKRPLNPEAVECAGLYWHFVDVVWMFLFPLLYLVGH